MWHRISNLKKEVYNGVVERRSSVARVTRMRARFFPNFAILSFLVLQLTLMVRCYTQDANYFGWQMFSYGMLYRINITATTPDGHTDPLDPAAYRQAVGGYFYKFLRPTSGYRVYGRGQRFLLSEVGRLPKFLCGTLDSPRRIEVSIEYREPMDADFTRRVYAQDCHA